MREELVILLGSGASAAFGLPTLRGLSELLAEQFSFVKDLKEIFSESPFSIDCEAVLSMLETLCEAVEHSQKNVEELGPSLLYYMSSKEVSRLPLSPIIDELYKKMFSENKKPREELERMKLFIYDACQVSEENVNSASIYYSKIFQELTGNVLLRDCDEEKSINLGINLSSGHVPLDIFTTNYDLLIENICDILRIPCARGLKEEGTTLKREVFYPELIESSGYGSVRLYKLHGSLDFYKVGDKIVRLLAPSRARKIVTGEPLHGELMIYPLHSKYVYSYPYLPLFKAFYERLCNCRVCLIIGHSMRDRGVNDVATSALIVNPRLKLIFVDENPDAIDFLNEKPLFLPDKLRYRSVIVKGKFGDLKVINKIIEALREKPGSLI
ncbi:MAG: SIR2 family protein [Candidatus Brockarchaeota archaeon]|nr:SIR2 family protein [Candidatus Brockarchaeota archaeon]